MACEAAAEPAWADAVLAQRPRQGSMDVFSKTGDVAAVLVVALTCLSGLWAMRAAWAAWSRRGGECSKRGRFRQVGGEAKPVILSISTAVPPYPMSQIHACDVAGAARYSENILQKIPAIYANTQIEKRHLAIPDFTPEAMIEGDSKLFEDSSCQLAIEMRLKRCHEVAIPLATRACKQAMQEAGVVPSDVTKLVIVTSTGILAPGLDCDLVRILGLTRDVDVTQCLYMGCAGGCAGLRVGCDYVLANPGQCALIFCIDLSSPHTTFENNMNSAILHAIFSDGCAAAVMKALSPNDAPLGKFIIEDKFCWLMDGTEDGITLGIHANGITCTLSRHLPVFLAKGIKKVVDSILSANGLNARDIDLWAVHPGGRKIVEAVEVGMSLSKSDTAYSWETLREYGNMLGPTLFFVLEKMLKRISQENGNAKKGNRWGIGFSFAPGVRAEGILFRVANESEKLKD